MKVVLFGTSPLTGSNGYSTVVYELAAQLAQRADVDLYIWAFQNFRPDMKHRPDLPAHVSIYDAWANENPKAQGFGFGEVATFVSAVRPDACVIFNDAVVVNKVLEGIRAAAGAAPKVVVYLDQVYAYQKRALLEPIAKQSDLLLAFTGHWRQALDEQVAALELPARPPVRTLRHAFDAMRQYPVPRRLARKVFGLKPDDFIVMQANRNTPRKRLDITMRAFAEVVARRPEAPIKLLLATSVDGAYSLLEVYQRELAKRGVPLDAGLKHLIFIDNPQGLSDADMNVLNNCADAGINTADGEGWGLCAFEGTALGIPQVAADVGGHKEFLCDECAVLVRPKYQYYVDATRDGVGGEAEAGDALDYAEGILRLYDDAALRADMGAKGRRRIVEGFRWNQVGEVLYGELKLLVEGPPAEPPAEDDVLLDVTAVKVTLPEPPSPEAAEPQAKSEVDELRAALAAIMGRLEALDGKAR